MMEVHWGWNETSLGTYLGPGKMFFNRRVVKVPCNWKSLFLIIAIYWEAKKRGGGYQEQW